VELKKKDSRQDMSDFPMKNGQKKNGVHPVTSPGTNVIKQYHGKLPRQGILKGEVSLYG
jgi:hypothetical protein